MRLLFTFLLATSLSYTQIPLNKHYSALDYGKSPRNWGISKSGEGLMYVGNSDGLLEYNGTDWRFIEIPGNTVREVNTNNDGTVFIGTLNNFGYLEKNDLGTMCYTSISDDLPEEDKPQTIWNISCVGNNVFFQSRTKVYIYNTLSREIKIIESPNFRWSYETKSNFYVLQNDGLFKYQDDSLVQLPDFNTGFFEKMIFSITDYDKDDLLLFSNIYGPTIYSIKNESFTPLDKTGKLKEWVNKYRFYGAEKIELAQTRKDARKTTSIYYVLISSDGGAIITNSQGQIVYRLSNETGVYSNNMNSVYFDKEQNILWFETYNGIEKVNLGYPVDRFNYSQNVTSRIHAIHEHDDDIYIATDNGLFTLNAETGNFDKIKGTNSQCWNLITIGNELLVSGGNNGLYVVRNKSIRSELYTESALFKILPFSEGSPFYIGATYTGLVVFQKRGYRYVNLGVIPNSEDIDFRYIEKDTIGQFWIGSTLEGFVKLQIPDEINPKTILEDIKLDFYQSSSGLNSIQNCKVFKVDNKLIYTSKNGIYKFNYDLDKFELYNPFNLQLHRDKFKSISIMKDNKNNLWLPESKIVIGQEPNLEYRVDYTSLNMIPVPATTVFHDENNISWIGTDDGLYRYGYDIELVRFPFKSKISKIKLEHNDSLLFKGSTSEFELTSSLPYSSNAIAFNFTSNEYIDEEGVLFKYRLSGLNENWSEWTTNRFKDYNRLREGDYTFEVKAKNIFGRESEISTFSFSITPPWFRTTFAYILYVVGGILLIFLSIRVSIYRLTLAKARLENVVRERTREITEKNREITDSINYAKRIQNAMLLGEEKSDSAIPEHFTLYKPKDIVSGDFYLARQITYKKQKYWYVIVGDCTGHGVPGGFLTMLGVSYLNEMISSDTGLIEPSEILDLLREKIIHDLNQSGQRDKSRDGMDMSVVRLNLETLEMSYAGANNPLWIVSKMGELKEIKADKQPISYHEKSKPFTNNKLKLQQGDTFYLFSDGFADQFGGANASLRKAGGKKYKSANFKKLLITIQYKTMAEQKEMINQTFEEWKGELEQLDDVCIIGVRL